MRYDLYDLHLEEYWIIIINKAENYSSLHYRAGKIARISVSQQEEWLASTWKVIKKKVTHKAPGALVVRKAN